MMLLRARTQRLCHNCRTDIQILFETGFCSAAPSITPANLAKRSSLRSKITSRHLSNSRVAWESTSKIEHGAQSQGPEHELLEEEEMLASQEAAIKALEKELGKPLTEAMEEDEMAAHIPAVTEGLSMKLVDSGYNLESAEDSIIQLRNEGASQAEIVRRARQLYGDMLPDSALRDEELQLYKRLYGEPSKGLGEDEEYVLEETDEQDTGQPILFTAEGDHIEYTSTKHSVGVDQTGQVPVGNDIGVDKGAWTTNFDPMHLRTQEVARSVGGEVVEQEDIDEANEDEDDEDSGSDVRAHPLTRHGRFATAPRTMFLNQESFIKPVERVMGNFSNKQLKEMCERTFGGHGLPDSPLTPRFDKPKDQVPVPLEAGQHTMGEMEANAFLTGVMPPTYASVASTLVETRKRLGPTWLNELLAKEGGPRVLDVGAGGAGIIAWRDIVKAHWDSMHSSNENPPDIPSSRSVVLTGSDTLRHRAADMLENTTFIPRLPDYVHTRDVPTLEDDRPAQRRKQFDVIIASHSLYGLKEEWKRKQHVQNLWSMLTPERGVLILIEKGIPRGFEALAGAREMLLERYLHIPAGHHTRYSEMAPDPLHKRETGMIIAPCTNHERCPMYPVSGLSRGRSDICSFQQRYIRPGFLQRVLGANKRNHDDVDFSYLSVLKGDDLRLRDITNWSHVEDPLSAPYHESPSSVSVDQQVQLKNIQAGFEEITDDPESMMAEESKPPAFHSLPRSVFSPMKRRGHVTLDLCTPFGSIERWTIPRSFSKQAYRDARKSRWGDLWALGAKTRVPRNLRLGTPEKDLKGKFNGSSKEVGTGRGRKERLKIQAMNMLEQRAEEKLQERLEADQFMAELDEEAGTPYDERRSTTFRQRDEPPKKVKKSKQEIVDEVDTFGETMSMLSSDNTSRMNDDEIDRVLSEFGAELEGRASGKGRNAQNSGIYGKASKEARRFEKEAKRQQILEDKANMRPRR